MNFVVSFSYLTLKARRLIRWKSPDSTSELRSYPRYWVPRICPGIWMLWGCDLISRCNFVPKSFVIDWIFSLSSFPGTRAQLQQIHILSACRVSFLVVVSKADWWGRQILYWLWAQETYGICTNLHPSWRNENIIEKKSVADERILSVGNNWVRSSIKCNSSIYCKGIPRTF